MTLRTLNYGNYGIFLIMGNAGFCPSTVGRDSAAASSQAQPEDFTALRPSPLLGCQDPKNSRVLGLGFRFM